MKFMQIHTFYQAYLDQFYRGKPGLETRSFAEQMRIIAADGFSAAHLFAPYLADLGHETRFVIANCVPLQFQWARENGYPLPRSSEEMHQLAAIQVETFQPDVLYLSDPIVFDSHFVRRLSSKPPLVMGWRTAVIPPSTDWSEFDLMLSSDEGCRQRALELGVTAVETFRPGFPSFLAHAVADQPRDLDVVFTGQMTDEHRQRLSYLLEVGKAPLGWDGEFSLAYYLSCAAPDRLPAGVRMYDKGAVWGLDMHRALRRAKISLNFHIDITGKGQNMRVIETTGTGTLLLTEASEDLGALFEPGREVETYDSKEELLEKIYYYLKHEDEREAIARRGQERCLRDHSMERRAMVFESIIRKHLGCPTMALGGISSPSAAPPQVATDFDEAAALMTAGHYDQARLLLRKIVEVCPHHAKAWHFLGIDALRRQDRAAIGLLSQAVEQAPWDWSIHFDLGRALRLAGHSTAARMAFGRALSLNPDCASPHLEIARLIQESGNTADALAHIQRAVDLDGSLTGSSNALAVGASSGPAAADTLRVTIVNTLENFGGAAQAANRLFRALRSSGGNVTMLVRQKTTNDDDVRSLLDPVDPARVTARQAASSRAQRAALAVAEHVRRERGYFSLDCSGYGRELADGLPATDLVNLHWVADFLDWEGFFGTLPVSIPVVWTLHDMRPFTGGCHYAFACERFTAECGQCPHLGSSDPADPSHAAASRQHAALSAWGGRLHLVAPSQWLAREALRSRIFANRPVSVIPNSLDLNIFRFQEKAAARARLGLPVDTRLILFIAHDVTDPRKGFQQFRQAVEAVRDLAGVTVLTVGANRPPALDLGFTHLHSDCTFDQERLNLMYAAADVTALPTRQDNLPNTMLESFASGTPVVGFSVGGVPDHVRPGETGYLAPADDAVALGMALREALTSGDRLTAMGRTARAWAEREFSPAVQAERYRALFASLQKSGTETQHHL